MSCEKAMPSPTLAPKSADRDWSLLFVLGYDNNLDGHAESIQAQLESAVPKRTGLRVLVDRRGESIREFEYWRGGASVRDLFREDLASRGSTLIADRLAAMKRELPAQHYALFLLTHGGGAGEMFLDESPEASVDEAEWASSSSLAQTLSGAALDLLFLQQCGRANLSTFYEFRETAEYTLAAQSVMFAPNAYYEGMLEALRRGDIQDGLSLARAIGESEAPSQSIALSAIRNSAFETFPRALEDLEETNDAPIAAQVTYRFHGQRFADLGQALERAGLSESHSLQTWIDEAVVYRFSNAQIEPRSPNWSGVSLGIDPPERRPSALQALSTLRFLPEQDPGEELAFEGSAIVVASE